MEVKTISAALWSVLFLFFCLGSLKASIEASLCLGKRKLSKVLSIVK